jgi:SNF2 family DNA or RNA helicase
MTIPEMWPHQSAALDFALSRPASMLPLKMGRGKSRVVIELIKSKLPQTTLIVCPCAVIDVWPREFSKYSNSEFFVLPLRKGTVKQKALEAKTAIESWKGIRPVIIIINYESLREPAFAAFALNQRFDLIVADEIHRIKSAGSSTSKLFYRLGRTCKWRLGLSGTPMAQTPLDIYGQYKFLDPYIFGTSFVRFRAQYAVVDSSLGFPRILRYQNLDDLNERFYSIAFKATSDLTNLPESIHTFRNCELEKDARSIYESLKRELFAEFDAGMITAANAGVKFLRLQQMTSGNLRLDDGSEKTIDRSKLKLLEEVLEEIGDEPVVIFARFKHDLRAINRMLLTANIKASELSGDCNELMEWQLGKSRVLVCQVQSGNAGIDLTRACYSILYSLTFSLSDYEQLQARTLRPGQTRNCVYVHLVTKNSIDEYIYKALINRQDVITAVMEMKDESRNTQRICGSKRSEAEAGRSDGRDQRQIA